MALDVPLVDGTEGQSLSFSLRRTSAVTDSSGSAGRVPSAMDAANVDDLDCALGDLDVVGNPRRFR